SANPAEIIRVDHGGLAFHGGLLGGVVSSWIYCKIKNMHWPFLLDLAVPGIALGIILIRVANIFNHEILGRETALLPFDRHPTQIYGSLIGLALLLIHNYLARRRAYGAGSLFWYFVLFYSLLRGLIEETFRENPLALWGYVNEVLGIGFFTAVHLLTPILVLLAWWMIRRINPQKE
ncbi:MAG: prolipoprotein diacylglyceryl transferase, partial [Bacillota bacterium]